VSRDENEQLFNAYRDLLANNGLDLAFSDLAPDRWPDPYQRGFFDPAAAKQVIRFLEQQRRYSSFDAVGTEPEADYLYRLATVGAKDGRYQGEGLAELQEVVNRLMVELRDALAALDRRLTVPVFAGVYPTGEFNARAHAVPPSGVLLLINSGLMDILFTVLKTNLASSFSGPDDPPLLDESQVTKVLAEAFNAYLYSESSTRSMGLPPLPRERAERLGYVLDRAKQFVLGHEMGHVALGHVQGDGALRRELRSPEMELAADSYAVGLLAALLQSPPGPKRDYEATYLAGGIMTFIEMAMVVSVLEQSLDIERRDASSHPDIAGRGAAIAEEIRRSLPGSDPLRRTGVFANWIGHYLPGVLEIINEANTLMKRAPYIKSW
jgi:hypothetical protein